MTTPHAPCGEVLVHLELFVLFSGRVGLNRSHPLDQLHALVGPADKFLTFLRGDLQLVDLVNFPL